MTLDRIEQVAKVIALIAIPIAVTIAPLLFSSSNKNKELALEYTRLAISIIEKNRELGDPANSLRRWAVNILDTSSPIAIDEDLHNNLVIGRISVSEDTMEHLVSTDTFISYVEEHGQLTNKLFEEFNESAQKFLSNYIPPDTHDDRWDFMLDAGGRLFIYRTRDNTEFSTALNAVLRIFEAIKRKERVPHVTINIRGSSRFYDIRGLTGVGSDAWIGFEFHDREL